MMTRLISNEERTVQEALDRIRAERKLTTVTVAHRLTTIVNSDKIVVIADGNVQESGTHRELVEEGGIYATLCEGQGLTADAADMMKTAETADSVPSVGGTAQVPLGDHADVEQAIIPPYDTDDKIAFDEEPSIKGVSSRLHEYSKSDIMYSVVGYVGAIVVGALPAGEAVLFGMITGNFFIISDAEEMRSVNYQLSLWFLLLAFLSFCGNILFGIGFGVSGSRLTRRMRVVSS